MKLTLQFDVDLYDRFHGEPPTIKTLEQFVKYWCEHDEGIGDVSNFEVLSWANK